MNPYFVQRTAINLFLVALTVAVMFLFLLSPSVMATNKRSLGGGNGKIAFLGAPRANQGFGICVLGVGDLKERCLTSFSELIGRSGFFWHPDGVHIISWDGNGKYYSIDSVTGERSELTQFKNFEALSLSPDGKRVAYPQQDQIFVADFDGGNKHKITDTSYSEVLLSWSPDGNKLAFAAKHEGEEDIYVVSGTTLMNLTQNASKVNPLFGISKPQWSPDGKQIAFTASSTDVMRVSLYLVNTNGTGFIDSNQNSLNEYAAIAWSPDSSRLLFGEAGIWLVNRDGSDSHTLSGSSVCYQSPSWSPDGTLILCGGFDPDTGYDLYALNVESGKAQRLTTDPNIDAFIGRWGPSPFDRGAFAVTLTTIAQTPNFSPGPPTTTETAPIHTTPSEADWATVHAQASQIIGTVTAMSLTTSP